MYGQHLNFARQRGFFCPYSEFPKRKGMLALAQFGFLWIIKISDEFSLWPPKKKKKNGPITIKEVEIGEITLMIDFYHAGIIWV